MVYNARIDQSWSDTRNKLAFSWQHAVTSHALFGTMHASFAACNAVDILRHIILTFANGCEKPS